MVPVRPVTSSVGALKQVSFAGVSRSKNTPERDRFTAVSHQIPGQGRAKRAKAMLGIALAMMPGMLGQNKAVAQSSVSQVAKVPDSEYKTLAQVVKNSTVYFDVPGLGTRSGTLMRNPKDNTYIVVTPVANIERNKRLLGTEFVARNHRDGTPSTQSKAEGYALKLESASDIRRSSGLEQAVLRVTAAPDGIAARQLLELDENFDPPVGETVAIANFVPSNAATQSTELGYVGCEVSGGFAVVHPYETKDLKGIYYALFTDKLKVADPEDEGSPVGFIRQVKDVQGNMVNKYVWAGSLHSPMWLAGSNNSAYRSDRFIFAIPSSLGMASLLKSSYGIQ